MEETQQLLPFFDVLVLVVGALAAGIYILVKGGNYAIDGAVSLARHLNISPLVIGFTIIAFGTSLPELIVSVNANLKGFPGLSIGNVIGSNISNILLVCGVSVFLVPFHLYLKTSEKMDIGMLLLSTSLLVGLLSLDVIEWQYGLVMVLLLVAYVFFQYRQALKTPLDSEGEGESETDIVYETLNLSAFFTIVGLFGIALGAELMVRSAVIGARLFHVPESVIGMTIVAVGTSLPELVTCIIAVKRLQFGIVIGNIVGSGVFNILSIVGVTALISPIALEAVSEKLLTTDAYVMMGVTAAFCAGLMLMTRLPRWVGLILLIGYIIFTFEQYYSFMV